ncbi:hypothetical protein FIV42_24980 [Persicimonas caeni]|uniref:Uncharacterized protein n=1 Tax=Persicimonas caeni TaxID=2292766 RepID=A0A4Y6PZW4_PERCE|nr:hypothetical protein [Persicimonas caeni]QDG53878.1 hypothetical protein FIV42_24980 [Persicimonas caeni]QED35099.1 hypothetical protein FRD00_24975 [Persicimonas caeni]
MTVEHREHIRHDRGFDLYEPFRIDMKAATIAGLVAGVVFLLFEMALTPAIGGWFWGPPHMMSMFAYGADPMPFTPGNFELGVFLVGVTTHLILSVVFTVALAVLVRRQSTALAAAIGAGYGFLLYIVNFYFFTAVFEWFIAARSVVNWAAHVLFGLIAGPLYVVLAHRFRERRHERVGTRRVETERHVEYPGGAEPVT